MRLRALSNINSGQFVAGDEFQIPDAEGQALVEAGAAVNLDDETLAATEPQPDGFPQPANEEVAPPQPPLENAETETPQPTEVPTETPQPTPEQIAEDLKDSEATSTNIPVN